MTARAKPMKFISDERQAQANDAKVLLRGRTIDVATYNDIINTLNVRERKANQRRQVAEVQRQAREAEAERKRREAEAIREAERVNRRRVQQQQYNEKRKERRRERRAEAIRRGQAVEFVLEIKYRYYYNNDKRSKTTGLLRLYDGTITPNFTWSPNLGYASVQALAEEMAEREEGMLHQQSPITLVKFRDDVYIHWRILTQTPVQPAPTNRNAILMREVSALALDGDLIQSWDAKNGTCVYDFLIWRYAEVPGCKKICTYEALDLIFTNSCEGRKIYIDCENCVDTGQVRNICDKHKIDMSGASYFQNASEERGYWLWSNVVPYQDANPRIDGVCVFQLELFCERIGTPMYALDEQDNIIRHYKPIWINKKCPPLVFRVKDNHIYAVLDRSRSISQIANRKTELEVKNKKKVEEGEKVEKALEFVLLERPAEGTPVQTMVQTMMDIKKQVFPFKNIKYDDTGLKGFKLDGKQYLFDEDKNLLLAQRIAELNDRPYTGESVYSIIMGLLEKHKYTKKSIHNPNVFKLLTTEGVKWRTHYGMVGDITPEIIQQEKDAGLTICVDIAKSHTSILTNPVSEWLQYNFNDDFVPYKGKLVPGLYYVETSDTTLFHCSNIYSHSIIQVARQHNIPHKIISQYLPTAELLPKNYFATLFEAIREECKGDKDAMKPIANMISGMLGKHRTKRYVARMNTDPAVVWDDFNTAPYHNNETFMEKCGDFYVYGYVVEQTNVETNIPMYIQVLDQNNIKLFNMIKESKGSALWRKTDCAIINLRGGHWGGAKKVIPEGKPSQPGDYRESEYPDISTLTPQKQEQYRECRLDTILPDWEIHSDITNSSQVKEVYDILMKHRGLVNVSRAGTGKSYNILELEKMFKANHTNASVYKIAFTNKASLNIQGTTIHKFLKINGEGKFNLEWLKSLANKPVLILIDEISMIGQWLWRRLVELKKALPKAYFVLCGDFRQVPPVEDLRDFDYFNCSAVKYLANFQKIEFIVRQRYDEALWDFAESVWEEREVITDDIGKREKDITIQDLANHINICYTNATRKYINKEVNEYVAKSKDEVYKVPYEPTEEDDKPIQQDAILYKGLPIIAHKNKTEEGVLETANNENFVIADIDEGSFTATTTRPNEKGEPEEHSVIIPTDEFHNRFLLNYCATTHKSQGATINADIYVWDYKDMSTNLKYTAITRAKKLSQVKIVMRK